MLVINMTRILERSLNGLCKLLGVPAIPDQFGDLRFF